MNRTQFREIIERTVESIHALNNTKGMEYADEGDALANFKARAAQLDLDPMQVWGVFFGKHADAIYAFIRNGKVHSEAIEGRIDDAILYLMLLKGLIEEKAPASDPQVQKISISGTPTVNRCKCGLIVLASDAESRTANGWRHRRIHPCTPLVIPA